MRHHLTTYYCTTNCMTIICPHTILQISLFHIFYWQPSVFIVNCYVYVVCIMTTFNPLCHCYLCFFAWGHPCHIGLWKLQKTAQNSLFYILMSVLLLHFFYCVYNPASGWHINKRIIIIIIIITVIIITKSFVCMYSSLWSCNTTDSSWAYSRHQTEAGSLLRRLTVMSWCRMVLHIVTPVLGTLYPSLRQVQCGTTNASLQSCIIPFSPSTVFLLYSVLYDLILILILYCMIWF